MAVPYKQSAASLDMLTPFLQEAAKITTSERRRDYGRPLINFLRIAIRWSNFLGLTISPTKVAAMMIDVKLARQQNTPKDDNWVDMIGYAACVSDMDEQLKELGYEEGIKAFQMMDTIGLQILYENVVQWENGVEVSVARDDEAFQDELDALSNLRNGWVSDGRIDATP